MDHAHARANPLPGILAAAGGVVVLVASFLPWFKADFGQLTSTSATANATDVTLGVVAIAGGVVLVAAGVFLLIGTASRRALGIVLLVAGLNPVGIAVYNLATKDQQVDAELRTLIERSTGQEATDEQLALVKQQLDVIGVETSFQIGIHLTILGGLAGMAGGMLALSAKEARPAPSEAGFGPQPPPSPAPRPDDERST